LRLFRSPAGGKFGPSVDIPVSETAMTSLGKTQSSRPRRGRGRTTAAASKRPAQPPGEQELEFARACSRRGDHAGAAEAARRALALDPNLAEAEVILGWAAWRANDAATAEAAAQRALALSPGIAEAELLIAWARSQQNDAAEAEGAAQRALALNPKLAQAELIVAWARARDGDFAAAEAAAQRALAVDPNLPQAELIVARARHRANDPGAAEAAAQRALQLDPKLVHAANIAAQAATLRGDVERTVEYYRHLAGLEPNNVRWALKAVAALDLGGRIAEARRELDRLTEQWPDNRAVQRFLELSGLGGTRIMESLHAEPQAEESEAPEAEEALAAVRDTEWRVADLRALYRRAPADAVLMRPVVVDEEEADVLVAECVGARTVVIVFTGTNDRVWLPLPMFDRYLAALGVSAVYLKDFRRLLFMQGVQSLGDSYNAAISALRRIQRGLKAKRICAFGHSGGGRAAIRYGLELGAARIVSIAGATGPAPCLNPAAYPRDQIIQARTLQHVPADMLDLKPFLQQRPSRAKITLVYGVDSASETASARYLEDLPSVRLQPVFGPSPTIMSLAAERDFTRTLARMFGIARPARATAAPDSGA
jgi:tetratricopeptide (TPR) repeat protein